LPFRFRSIARNSRVRYSSWYASGRNSSSDSSSMSFFAIVSSFGFTVAFRVPTTSFSDRTSSA
jgi:hypothetical protein